MNYRCNNPKLHVLIIAAGSSRLAKTFRYECMKLSGFQPSTESRIFVNFDISKKHMDSLKVIATYFSKKGTSGTVISNRIYTVPIIYNDKSKILMQRQARIRVSVK